MALSTLVVVSLFAAPALATAAGAADCICALLTKEAGPDSDGLGMEQSGVTGAWQVSPNANLEKFGDAVRDCLDENNVASVNMTKTCMPSDISMKVHAVEAGGGNATASSDDRDLTLAVGGDESATSHQDGGSATATNTSDSGAAVAVGGQGGGRNANAGDGGAAQATSKGGDAKAKGGEGGDPSTQNNNAGGNGGSASATSDYGTASTTNGGTGAAGTPGTHGTGASASSGEDEGTGGVDGASEAVGTAANNT
jgi:hypothetical protein